MRHLATRGVVAVLTAFLAVTTISGALLVVPTLPLEWLEGSIFSDYSIPTMALAAVGGMSLVALLAVVIRPDAMAYEALEVMENRPSQIAVLPVVESGRCVGLVRLHDLMRIGL